jgi:hypothetical protein
VAQGVGSEFKPHYHQKKKKKESEEKAVPSGGDAGACCPDPNTEALTPHRLLVSGGWCQLLTVSAPQELPCTERRHLTPGLHTKARFPSI